MAAARRSRSQLSAEDARAELLAALREGRCANRDLRQALQEGERALGRVERALERDEPIAQVAEDTEFGRSREAMSAALDSFEVSRHRVKVAAFALANAEQTSIGRLSRLWGISRQLGARYAREASISQSRA